MADWASEMENVDIGSSDYDYGAPKIVIDRKNLPSAPRAARGMAQFDCKQILNLLLCHEKTCEASGLKPRWRELFRDKLPAASLVVFVTLPILAVGRGASDFVTHSHCIIIVSVVIVTFA